MPSERNSTRSRPSPPISASGIGANVTSGVAVAGASADAPDSLAGASGKSTGTNGPSVFSASAACHLALGMGFAETIRGFENKTLEECRALGINDSMLHVDFMIGTADMNIDAQTHDGKTVAVFRDGNWAR